MPLRMGQLLYVNDASLDHGGPSVRQDHTTMRQADGVHVVPALSHGGALTLGDRMVAAPVKLFVCEVCGYIEMYSAVDKDRLAAYFKSK